MRLNYNDIIEFFTMQDVCALYPCQDGETCVRKGGATCFDSDGCEPDDLRLCGETIMQ